MPQNSRTKLKKFKQKTQDFEANSFGLLASNQWKILLIKLRTVECQTNSLYRSKAVEFSPSSYQKNTVNSTLKDKLNESRIAVTKKAHYMFENYCLGSMNKHGKWNNAWQNLLSQNCAFMPCLWSANFRRCSLFWNLIQFSWINVSSSPHK